VSEELSCQEIVELVTDYVEEDMPPDERSRFERHLSYCPGCLSYVEQIRETIRATGEIPREETLPSELRAGLVAQFKNWKRSP
jgi:anti-sigma factor (TIGR02949 family)